MTTRTERHCEVLLAVQLALLGEVTRNLRAVAIEFDDRSIAITAYLDGPPNASDEESMSFVQTEVIATFPASHEIRMSLIPWPEPKPLPKAGHWAFLRKEPLAE